VHARRALYLVACEELGRRVIHIGTIKSNLTERQQGLLNTAFTALWQLFGGRPTIDWSDVEYRSQG